MSHRILSVTLCVCVLLAFCACFGVPTEIAFASDNCDKAYTLFSKGRFGGSGDAKIEYYLEAIQLCPGFIRPYELVGYWYQQKREKEKAIAYFSKAAELGTKNHKLYYLLAGLLLDQGDLNGASKNLNKALGIRGDYREALELKAKLGEVQDREGPELILYEPDTRRGPKVIHNDVNLTVRGLATDKSGIAWVKINGADASLDEEGNFLKDIPIQKGPNTITVEAADRADNRSRVSVNVEGEEPPPPVQVAAGKAERPETPAGEPIAVVTVVDAVEIPPPTAPADAKAAEEKGAAEGLRQKAGEIPDREGPEIALYEPAARRGVKVVLKDVKLTVRGLATDKSGIAWVKINSVDAPLDEQGNFLAAIPVQKGANTITVEAADRLDNRSRISFTVDGDAQAAAAAPWPTETPYEKSFAVVIGVDAYEKWPALEFAVADAKAVKRKLEANGFDQITMILDKQATQRRILTEIFDELPKKVGSRDRVIFYFAGHGQTEDLPEGRKRGYVIPVDGDTSNYSSTAISMEQIRSLSSRISAKHILYVMDSCYSGLGLSRSLGLSPKLSDYLKKVGSMRVVQIITAGGQGEQVQESEGHGLFTMHFLKALDGEADIDKDNVVTGTELGAYLRPAVSNASRQAQTPLYGRLEGEGEFLFFVQKPKEQR
ncbi:MAG: caspase family protein [Thermodesulfobacteriota bacterium]